MPELAEVETTRRGILPYIANQPIAEIIIRHHRLRWPVPGEIVDLLPGEKFNSIERRGKYLLFNTQIGTLIVHLGMSGCLRVIDATTKAKKHDHFDIIFDNGIVLRYSDPRRFGAILWTTSDPLQHKLLQQLGPEPLTNAFNTKYLSQQAEHRNVPIKTFIMNSHVVVGVGNIYATESLYRAGIHPLQPAGKLTLEQLQKLVQAIKTVLRAAIKQGGTTLRDFRNSDGKPGYFRQHLQVYGRAGELCLHCQTELVSLKIAQRSTVFCPNCQSAKRSSGLMAISEYDPKKREY